MRTHGQVLSMTVALLGASAALAQGSARPTVPIPLELSGKLERVTVHGDSLEGNLSGDSADRPVSVYLPPSYAAQPNRRYPVLYLLHGFTDTDENWFGLAQPHFVNVPGAVDRAVANGARELIVVMPNSFTKFSGSMYSSSVATGDWEAYVARDLVAYVDSHYRTLPTRASRGLAGHSMGGYGTVRIGMKYPQVFSSLYSMSPCCMAANLTPSAQQFAGAAAVKNDADVANLKQTDFGTKAMLASAAAWSANPAKPPLYIDLPVANGQPVPDVIARWAANAPLAMVHQYIPALRSFRAIAIDVGDRDAGIADTVRTLDEILIRYGIDHTTEIYSGNHLSGVDHRLEANVLPFFSRHLAFD